MTDMSGRRRLNLNTTNQNYPHGTEQGGFYSASDGVSVSVSNGPGTGGGNGRYNTNSDKEVGAARGRKNSTSAVTRWYQAYGLYVHILGGGSGGRVVCPREAVPGLIEVLEWKRSNTISQLEFDALMTEWFGALVTLNQATTRMGPDSNKTLTRPKKISFSEFMELLKQSATSVLSQYLEDVIAFFIRYPAAVLVEEWNRKNKSVRPGAEAVPLSPSPVVDVQWVNNMQKLEYVLTGQSRGYLTPPQILLLLLAILPQSKDPSANTPASMYVLATTYMTEAGCVNGILPLAGLSYSVIKGMVASDVGGSSSDSTLLLPSIAVDMIGLVEGVWRKAGCRTDQEKDIWFRAIIERSQVMGLDEMLDSADGGREELKKYEAYLISSPDTWIEFFGSAVDGAFEGLAKRIVASYSKKRGGRVSVPAILVTRTEEVLLTHQRLLQRIIDMATGVSSSVPGPDATSVPYGISTTNTSASAASTPTTGQSLAARKTRVSPQDVSTGLRHPPARATRRPSGQAFGSSREDTPVSLTQLGGRGDGGESFLFFDPKDTTPTSPAPPAPLGSLAPSAPFPSYKPPQAAGLAPRRDGKGREGTQKAANAGDSVINMVKRTKVLPPLAPSLSTKAKYSEIDNQILAAEWEDVVVVASHRGEREGQDGTKPGLYGKLPCQNTKTSCLTSHNFPKHIAGQPQHQSQPQTQTQYQYQSRTASDSLSSTPLNNGDEYSDSQESYGDGLLGLNRPFSSTSNLLVGGRCSCRGGMSSDQLSERSATAAVGSVGVAFPCDLDLPDLPQITYQATHDTELLQDFGPMNKTTVELTKAFIDALQIVNGAKGRDEQPPASFERSSPLGFGGVGVRAGGERRGNLSANATAAVAAAINSGGSSGASAGVLGGASDMQQGRARSARAQRGPAQPRMGAAGALPARLYMKATESSSMKRRM